MRYRAIDGLRDRVATLVMGTLTFRAADLPRYAALLDRYVEAGGNIIDTALAYEAGESERALGAWLAQRGRRDDLIVITKGAHHAPDGTHRVTPEGITEDLTRSLGNLGIDSIDLYMLHRDDPAIPVGTIVECLNAHVEAGRIGSFAASNWTHTRIAEANEFAAARGLRGFVASSPNFALAVPHVPICPRCISVAGDREALTWYRAIRFPLLAWSSQAGGFFSGRFQPNVPPNPSVAPYYAPDNWERLARVQALARLKGCRPMQLALAWTLHQSFPVFPLIGPRTLGELDDSLAALDIELTPAEVAWLDLRESVLERAVGRIRAVASRTPVSSVIGSRRRPPPSKLRLGLHLATFVAGRTGNEADSIVAQARQAEAAGIDTVTLPDHFMVVRGDPKNPDQTPLLECFVTLGAIAAATSRIRLGPMVAGVPYRNPALVAKMIATLDQISHGRALYGIGASWDEGEHRAYGWTFDPIAARMRRMEEAIQVATRLWTERPASFTGTYYRIENAICDPPCVQRPRVPIMIGGDGLRTTLRLVATYADYCNVAGTPAEVALKFDVLRRHCEQVGRPIAQVTRTNVTWILIGRD